MLQNLSLSATTTLCNMEYCVDIGLSDIYRFRYKLSISADIKKCFKEPIAEKFCVIYYY